MNNEKQKGKTINVVVVFILVLIISLFFIVKFCFFTLTHSSDRRGKHPNYLPILPNVENKPIVQILPKIIHQTWKTTQLPANFASWSHHCREIHSDSSNDEWQYLLWTDDDNRRFLALHYPWFLETYDNYDVHIKRVDAIRYFLLYYFGGVYMDMDFVCLKRLDTLLGGVNTAVFGYQLEDTDSPGAIANAFMAAPPQHPLFQALILGLENTKDKPVLEATGPNYLTQHIRAYSGRDVVVHEMPILYTHEWNKKDKRLDDCAINVAKCRQHFPSSYTTTIWTGTWL